MKWVISGMIYAGSILMIYNIYGFVRFARYVRSLKSWNQGNSILNIPIVLLVLFLLGYLAVGFFGKPDLIMAGILFGGSIFVFIMYKLLNGITKRIVENERLKTKLMAAEESNRAKTSFLASMSHEMRTPLNAIIGLDAIALQDDTISPQLRDRLEKIEGSAKHLLGLINDVLDMSTIELSDLKLKRERFSLRRTLGLVSVLAHTRCDEKGLAFHSDFICIPDEDCIGDEERLEQILLNILGNAVKFTPEGGSVAFTAEQLPTENERIKMRFKIRDTGIGIDPDFLPHIFDSFSQEDISSTNRFGGSGLGLAITKTLVNMMDGDIEVSSERGKGSEFVVTVLLDKAPEQEEKANGESERAPLNGRRVLIAEDIDLNAEMLADLLEMEGISSERAVNGKVADEMFYQHPSSYYDAILMDLRMPVMDGLDAAKCIRAMDRPDATTIPIIALTANTSEEDVRNTMEAGMDAHLPKPVDINTLYQTLGRLIVEKKTAEKSDSDKAAST